MSKENKGIVNNPVEIEITLEEAWEEDPKKEEILEFVKKTLKKTNDTKSNKNWNKKDFSQWR